MKACSIAVLLAALFISDAARAQTTMFTYQGQLDSSGVAANGLYDFQFQLVTVNTNPVSGLLTNAPVGVTNGFFTTALDFGSTYFNGQNLWIQVGVRTNGSAGAYTLLSPLQPITSVPYAIRALNAANASNAVYALNAANSTNAMFLTVPLQTTNLSGTIAFSNLPSNVAFLNSNETFSGAISFTNAVNVSGVATLTNGANTFNGNGFGLASLNATNLTGIIADSHLSTNVALQSSTALNFAGSVGATNFIGAGHGLTNVPGAFFWVTVSGSIASANPNVGYICTNNTTPVTITLPASPSVGDTYKVAGLGDAGWIIAQNANQQIFAGNLSSSVGQSWKASASGLPVSANWTAITCSADGTKMAAVNNIGNNVGYTYTSSNSGTTWVTNTSTTAYWSDIASSADGTHLIASAGYSPNLSQVGEVYVSINSGATWAVSDSSSTSWSGVACSADGTKMAAAVRGGAIYINYGSGWGAAANTTPYQWNSIAMSADGTKLVAVEGGGVVATSTNSGSTWIGRTNFTSPNAVACSSDGTRMTVVTAGGQIYLSTDTGVTWVSQNSPISGDLTAIASSADGSRQVATVGGSGSGSIYGSSNSGGTWSQLPGAPTATWSGIASSADGSTLAAMVYGGGIYVSTQSSTTSGNTGYLTGAQHSVIELLYVGNGQFLPLSSEGTVRAY